MSIVAAIQMASAANVVKNVQMACEAIEQAADKGAKLVVLPECFATLGLGLAQTQVVAEPFKEGPIQAKLAKTAKKNKIWVVGGTIPLIGAGKNKAFASCLVWDSQGKLVKRYDKIHLFDVTVAGKEVYRESDSTKAGKQIQILDTPVGKMGMGVCYDLRFPELFRVLALKGAQIITLPSAFTIRTGRAHWEILLKARAIENLCYVVAPNQVGFRANGLGTYGHSMIVDPWGKRIASTKTEEAVIVANVDLAKMKQIREQFPVLTHYQSFVMQNLVEMSQKEKV